MPDISGINPLQGPKPVERKNTAPASSTRSESTSREDRVEISSEAKARADVAGYVQALKNLPEVRQERIDAIRKQINEGTYDIDGKLGDALDGLLDDLGMGGVA